MERTKIHAEPEIPACDWLFVHLLSILIGEYTYRFFPC